MTLGRIGAGLLRPVNVNERPYPWVGSGTHAWVHYGPRSRSHVCQLNFTYYGNVSLDWGDGSPKVSLSGGQSPSAATQSHEYTDGDWRIDISGDTPLEFGHWNATTGAYENTSSNGFISDDTPFSQTDQRRVPSYRDHLVQFETDALAVVGSGNENGAQIGATANLKWVNFTAATELGRWPLGRAMGICGVWAPKVVRVHAWGELNQATGCNNFRVLEMPNLQYLFDRSGNNPAAIFDAAINLVSLDIPFGVTNFPMNFLNRATSLRHLRFLPDPSNPSSSLRTGITFGANAIHRCFCLEELVLPEGVTSVGSEPFAFLFNVKTVDLPSTFESASNYYSFLGTYSLERLICRATTPPAIGSAAFSAHAPGAKFYIPYGTTSAYSAATNWSKFQSLFVELDANGNIPQA